MSDLTADFGDSEEAPTRERAASAFLYLGAKLKSLYRGEARSSRKRSQLSPDGAAALIGAIEGEIIPRLMLAHEPAVAPTDPPRDDKLSLEDREQFLASVTHDSADVTRAMIDALLGRGVTQETILLDLLATTARRLGELWEEDRVDFTDVTIGLCRLHQVLREQGAPWPDEKSPTGDRRAPRILLTTACADQHVFGVLLVAEFFRRASWRVRSEPGATRDALSSLLAEQTFEVLGLSAACSTVAEDVGEDVAAFREAARNREMKILVGGRLFVEDPGLVARIGADGAAFDAKTAPLTARAMLERADTSC
ncbi:MAG: cobalamin-dependent protein [Myxococcota bacterium]|nr:cobalamin-dependent protein [Myxococcota bacterium]